MKDTEQDKIDYLSALEVKNKNRKWLSHSDLKKILGKEKKMKSESSDSIEDHRQQK